MGVCRKVFFFGGGGYRGYLGGGAGEVGFLSHIHTNSLFRRMRTSLVVAWVGRAVGQEGGQAGLICRQGSSCSVGWQAGWLAGRAGLQTRRVGWPGGMDSRVLRGQWTFRVKNFLVQT